MRTPRAALTLAMLLVGGATALAAAAPAAAQRVSGLADLDAQTAFTMRGIDDADGVAALGDVDGDGSPDVGLWSETGNEVRVVLGGDRVPG
ncbi:MAG: hypothetical protein M3389_02900, partial [Actinomycetota bacterium]|nr:hypothetical protein [Actinomycetota bacterium]